MLLTLIGIAFIVAGIGAIAYLATTNNLSVLNYFAYGFFAMPPIGVFFIILDGIIAGKSLGLKHTRRAVD